MAVADDVKKASRLWFTILDCDGEAPKCMSELASVFDLVFGLHIII